MNADLIPWLCIAVFIIFVAFDAVFFLPKRNKRLSAPLERLAAQRGGQVLPGPLGLRPQLELVHAGRTVQVIPSPGGRHSNSSLLVAARNLAPKELLLYVFKAGWFSRTLMAGGARPFDTGNAAFQQAYVAGGKPVEQASRLLTPAIQNIFVQAASEEPVLRVARGWVQIEFSPLGTDPAVYERRLEIALQIIENWPG